MERKNFVERNKRKFSVTAIAALGMTTLVACANTSGGGNDFKLTGTIVSVGDRSVRLSAHSVDVTEDEGDASGWFSEDKEHQVHDNYRDCNWGLDIHTVGHEYNKAGLEIELTDIQPGDVVEIDGRIRDSYDRCGKASSYDERAVFDTLTDQSR